MFTQTPHAATRNARGVNAWRGDLRPGRRRRPAFTIVYVLLCMLLLSGFVSLAIDWGRVQLAKTELQAAADSAARAACGGFEIGVPTAQSMAVQYAAYHTADGTTVALDVNNDVEFGTWDSVGKTFTPLSGGAQSSANAIRVTARRTAATGNPISLTFAQLIGKTSCDVKAIAIALPGGGGYGVVGLSSISMSGNATDSYNSTTSTDPTASQLHHGTIASNGTIALSGGSSIEGDAHPGVGKSVTTSGGSYVTGSTTSLTSSLNYPNVSAGSYATTNDDGNMGTYINGSHDFSIGGGKTLALPSGNYYTHNFTVSGGSALSFTGPATLWVTGQVNISELIGTSSSRPGNLKINMCSANDFTISVTNGSIYANVYAPQSKLTISNGNLAGAVVCNQLVMSGSAKIYFDQSIPTYGAGISLAK